MKFIDLQRLSLDEMTATSSESGTAEPNTATAVALPPPPLSALVSVSRSSSFRRLSRPRKDSEAAVHAALPEVVRVGVAAAKNPKAIYPIEASWDVESFSQRKSVRLMERPWYVRRVVSGAAASPRRSAPSKHRREHPHRIIASSHRRIIALSSHRRGGRERGARDDDARPFDRARGGATRALRSRSASFGARASSRPHFHSNDIVHCALAIRSSSRVARAFARELRCMVVGGCGGGGWRWRWWLVVVGGGWWWLVVGGLVGWWRWW